VVLAVRVALVVPEDPAVPAVRVALVVPEDPAEPAVLENPVVPAERELVQVAAERELARAVAELEHGPVAVPLRIKSVTAAHHRGLVPVPKRAEDLAAVAETMRDKAATEAGTAWVAAV
jgi:hypothetical protein